MFIIFISDFKIWSSFAYVFYAIALFALVAVELLGITRLGAQRWVNLYFFNLQPSELMKLALIFALARYYSMLTPLEIKRKRHHLIPMILTIAPALLILKQPDLGTASLFLGVGFGMIFLSGFPLKTYGLLMLSGIMACPFGWFFLRDYQKSRILNFLHPDKDPLGQGYHVLQSKIAIGSGHIFGKGFLNGSQSKLNFLPEKNTDFIFTTIAEESGFLGASIVLLLLIAIVIYFVWAAWSMKTMFSKLLCGGLAIFLFLHVFINVAMVMGLVPVVGIPLPFLSYGGSTMLTFMISCGLIMAALSRKSL
jgi:rod shape determining protein RodA